jgi:ATP-dependent Zn protease
MVYLAGRASESVFFGEPFRSVGGDYAGVRHYLGVLFQSGMFGPPIQTQAATILNPEGGNSMGPGKDKVIEQYWKTLEGQVEQILRDHAVEVHAVASALLIRNDLTGKEAIEIMDAARAEALAQGKEIPQGLPEMIMRLLPEHQQTPADVQELEPAPSSD